jgi:hypothetical protein
METLSMNAKERRRLTEFSRVKDGLISVAEAARRLGLSERQGRRLWKNYRQEGDSGLLHGLRGKPGNACKGPLRDQVLALYRRKFLGFGAAHAADMLADGKLKVSRKSLWRWLAAEHLIVKTRRVKKHRCRRQRRACVGELVQMDGSTHQWLGKDQPLCVLFVMIDDATSRVFARFYESEDTASAFDLFRRYVKIHGLPGDLYVDKDSIYRVNDAEARAKCRQAGKKPPLTQFGRAMDALGVGIIAADSPQAKGRVERVNGTLQDRLVKELALAGIASIASANRFMETHYLQAFNDKFAIPPARGINAHRKVPAGMSLDDVLCPQESRTVGQDWCIRLANRILQIDEKHGSLSLAGRKIMVLVRADGTVKLVHQDKTLSWRELATRPVNLPEGTLAPAPRTLWRPAAHHPWREPMISPTTGRDRGEVKPAALQSDSLRSPSLRSAGLTSPPGGVTVLLRR